MYWVGVAVDAGGAWWSCIMARGSYGRVGLPMVACVVVESNVGSKGVLVVLLVAVSRS